MTVLVERLEVVRQRSDRLAGSLVTVRDGKIATTEDIDVTLRRLCLKTSEYKEKTTAPVSPPAVPRRIPNRDANVERRGRS